MNCFFLSIVFCVFSCFNIFANSIEGFDFKNAQVKKLVTDYYENLSLEETFLKFEEAESITQFDKMNRVVGCHEPSLSCIDVACLNVGVSSCDSIYEIKQVAKSCRGNYNGNCLKSICDHLGTSSCDSLNEINEVAPLCIGNIDSGCIDSVCRSLGSSSCDSIYEIKEVAKICAGLD